MTDDAQPPAAPENNAGHGADGTGAAASGVTPGAAAPGGAPAAGAAWTPPQWPEDAAPEASDVSLDAGAIPEVGQDAPPRVPLDKGAAADPRGPEPDPWAPPAHRAPAGPGETIVSSAGSGAPVPPSVHDQQTVTSFPAADASPPWAAPTAQPGPGTPSAGTPASFPPPNSAVGHPAPFPPPNPAAGNPFAAPAPGPQDLPPPPIAPDGPGQVPYGYPAAGYGYPAPPQQVYGGAHTHGAPGYYGWPGGQPEPSNGMGTASLVVGIVGVVVFCLWPVAIVLGILAVIFGGLGRAKASRGEATNPGMALAGIICGAAGVVLAVVVGLLVILAP
ncbi:DUF4190 domain-containing protein [Streptomyces sp. NPDC059861]|uniref:DUF4190 domain-containing protein n=1 Tax=Streptomyces sp. NPDC059861 TaxID=3346974 RepID=UPI003665040F